MSKPTYCLHKLQEVLAEFLNIDVKSLPSIEDNLKAAGYIGIQKNDEIEYFSKGLEEFGTNYPQYYHKPQEAITHLLETKEGQVAGAFHKEGLGDIDLVWGKITDAENHKGYGLAHILDKRTAEFMQEGLSKEQAEIKAREFATQTMPKIVEKGSIVENAGVKTIILKEGDSEFRVGLSKGFYGKGDNEWIITSYERKNPNAQNFDQATNSKELENGNNLSLKDSKENSTTQSQTTYKNYDDAPTPANPHQSEHNINTSSVNRIDGDIKTDSTTELSPFARALQEKRASLEAAEAKMRQREAKLEQTALEYKQEIENIVAQKQALAGLSANEQALTHKAAIPLEEINAPTSYITINETTQIPLKYVKVKASDVAPNFKNSELQPRTEKNQLIINIIAGKNQEKPFDPTKILGNGGFKDLPIITQSGAVIVGNHRAQGFKEFTQQAREAYNNAIKEYFNIALKDDELLLRTPAKELSDKELLDLAFASNIETTQNIGDKILSALGKYSKNIDSLSQKHFSSETLAELEQKVARALEPHNAEPDKEAANMALFASLAKNSNSRSIAQTMNDSLKHLDLEAREKLKDMYVKNAGSFYNIANDVELRNIDVRPYLLDSIAATAKALKTTRAENFRRLNQNIEHIVSTTDSNGINALIDYDIYKDTLSDLLGNALARFARLENPATSLYEAFKTLKDDLKANLEPTLFSSGKPLKEADVYDVLRTLIASGEKSEQTSKTLELLPALREKERAYKIHKAESNGNSNTNSTDGATHSIHTDNGEIIRQGESAQVGSLEQDARGTSIPIDEGIHQESATQEGIREIDERTQTEELEVKIQQKKEN